MKVILFSSLVSLVTLMVLLFNRSTPKEIKIPSSFLGGKKMQVPRRLALTRPPWPLWFLVLAATIGASMAYLPPEREGRSEGAKSTALVWVDDTFSAAVSRADESFDSDSLVNEILALQVPLVGLVPSINMVDGKPSQTVQLAPLESRPELSKFIKKMLGRPPNAMTRPLKVEDVSRALALDTRFSAGKGTLVLVTDAQRSTLRNFLSLRSFFQKVKLIASREPETLIGASEQIVPSELMRAWSGSDGTDSQSDWIVQSDHDERVPLHARPGVIRETFGKEKMLSIVSAQSALQNSFPLAIVCSTPPSGSIEFDAAGDLRSLLRFFSSSFRFDECDEETQAALQLDKSEWRFRRAAVWIVPLRADVAQTLTSGRFWLPRGFVAGSDALVYAAPTRTTREDSDLLSLQTIQLETGGSPSAIYLSPLPPEDALRLRGNSTSAPERNFTFAPLFLAADGTQLGFRAEESKIFYLRTTLVMPNGELGRSGDWTRFWLTVGGAVGRESPGLKMVSLSDWSDLSTFISSLEPNEKLSLFLNPQTLKLEQVDAAEEVRAGVHLSPETLESTLIDIPREERARDYVVTRDFEESWLQGGERDNIGEKVQREKRTLPLTGVLIAGLALFSLWLFKSRFRFSGVVLFLIFGQEYGADAQIFDTKFVNVQNVPFRISWCEQDVPSGVANRYRELREALARRGTIRLAEEILGGRCKAGASELWWTDTVDQLKSKEVAAHLAAGGAFILEGQKETFPASEMDGFTLPAVGLIWERPPRRGMLYRSFYLLHSFDGCLDDKTLVLRLRKKVNAQSIAGISSSARFLSQGSDCFASNNEFRIRSFVNLVYALLTTDYKEDHMQLPELLSRVRNLGLEP